MLAEKYELIEKIGEGGMGVVWLARDRRLETDVAVKVLHSALVGDEHAALRLRNEARAAAKIAHPGICRVTDVAEHEGAPFLVMELLRGVSLADRLASDGPMAPLDAVRVVREVLSALEAAHREGVLHRDLKPENVFLCDDDLRSVKLLDFGVAKILGDHERVKLTRSGALIGTPAYMSPEQARGHSTDERSDLWSTGVMLYEMLAGALPYESQNYQGMLVAIATEPPIALSKRCPSVDPALEAIVSRALTVDSSARVASATELLGELAAWQARQEGLGLSDRPLHNTPRARTGRRSPTPKLLTLRDPTVERPSRRWLLLSLGVFSVILAASWGNRLLGRRDPATSPVQTVAPRVTATRTDGRASVVASTQRNEHSQSVVALVQPTPLPDAQSLSGHPATSPPRVLSHPATRTSRVAHRGRVRGSDAGAGIGVDPDF
ncbi:MAG: serine/threonine-protein kinase [Deltaproteobacteria bacterium]|nr:serine/threonine-protein kinase [Deltaproteobacteria bacterium]